MDSLGSCILRQWKWRLQLSEWWHWLGSADWEHRGTKPRPGLFKAPTEWWLERGCPPVEEIIIQWDPQDGNGAMPASSDERWQQLRPKVAQLLQQEFTIMQSSSGADTTAAWVLETIVAGLLAWSLDCVPRHKVTWDQLHILLHPPPWCWSPLLNCARNVQGLSTLRNWCDNSHTSSLKFLLIARLSSSCANVTAFPCRLGRGAASFSFSVQPCSLATYLKWLYHCPLLLACEWWQPGVVALLIPGPIAVCPIAGGTTILWSVSQYPHPCQMRCMLMGGDVGAAGLHVLLWDLRLK